MFKCFFLIVFSLVVLFVINPNEPFVKTSFSQTMPSATPLERNEPEKLVLDRDKVCRPCPPGNRPMGRADCDDIMKISVSAGKSKDDGSVYVYTVSGGRIIGEGAKVVWDVTDAEPGTYQIRVDIEDKFKGRKQTESKVITVENHNCCGLCVCPTVSVKAPASPTKTGETMTFEADVRGGVDSITYNWTVSEGEIIEGQGTPFIKVATNSKMAGKTVKATVEIGGICEDCEKNASADGLVAGKKLVEK